MWYLVTGNTIGLGNIQQYYHIVMSLCCNNRGTTLFGIIIAIIITDKILFLFNHT